MDGAAVRPLIDQGALPCFARAMESGASGDLAPGSPTPMAGWGSMATGLPAHRHGITAPVSVRADGAGVAATGARDWGAPPFWRSLEAAGIGVALVNLPATGPAADAGASVVVDQRFFTMPEDGAADWPLARGCVHPVEHRPLLRAGRVDPGDLAGMDLGDLPPEALAEAGAIQAAALRLLTDTDAEVVVVGHPVAARVPGDAALRFLDRAVDALLHAGGPAIDLLLASPGGLLLATGAGFAPDTLLHGAQPADVAASVLARFGLPVAGGRPLNGVTSTHAPLPPPVRCRSVDAGAPAVVREVERDRALALAIAAMNDGDHRHARQLVEPVVAETPLHPEALLLLGQCCFVLQDWPACLAIGRTLGRLSPDRPWGAMMQGAGLLMTGHRVEALPLLDLAAARSAGNAAALCKLGALGLHAGEPDLARRHYAGALALHPADPDALAGMGLALLATGDLASGERHLKASLARRFHAPAIHQQMALLHAHLGRDADAEASERIAREQMAATG